MSAGDQKRRHGSYNEESCSNITTAGKKYCMFMYKFTRGVNSFKCVVPFSDHTYIYAQSSKSGKKYSV